MDLLASYPVDVVKVDIVGAERFLLDVPPKLLRSVDEWLIQSNSFESASALMNLFSSIGFFTVVCFVVDSHVIFYCVKSAYHEDA